jgi:hypothetical protein
MGRPKGSRNRSTILREAHQTVVARGLMGHEQDLLDSLHVMEAGMQHFFTKAMTAKANNGKMEIIDANILQAVSIAEKIAPYRHARLSAMKLAGDPNAHKEIGDDAPLEELKRLVEGHLMNLGPVLDLQILPLNGDDDLDEPEPGDEIADCDGPYSKAGNDAGAPQGRRRARDHRGGMRYRHD